MIASEGLVLALDQGTSSTKAALFSCDGHEVTSTSRRTVTTYPDLVGAVGDPESWWDALVGCIRELLKDAAVRSRVVGVAVCGFMHTLVPISEDGRSSHLRSSGPISEDLAAAKA